MMSKRIAEMSALEILAEKALVALGSPTYVLFLPQTRARLPQAGRQEASF